MSYINIINQKILEVNEKINKLPKEEFLKCAVNHQRMSSCEKNSDNVLIGKSRIKNGGNGIFAKKDFAAGDIICLYQPYIIVDKKNKKVMSLNKENYSWNSIIDKYGDYMLNLENDVSVFGNPDFSKNKDYLGHMPNDRGYSPFKIYNENFNNGFFSFLYLIASKPIKKNSEIFISYGRDYWYKPHKSIPGGTSRHLYIKKNIRK